jgi:DNA-binding HxlR family transcriptional regulator
MADGRRPDRGPRSDGADVEAGQAGLTLSALEVAVGRVGDRWSLLVVDALLGGPQRFGDLAERVVGVAPNVLSRRLRDLEAAGVVVAEPYSTRPLRHEYRLTPLGRDLAPALAALSAWGARLIEEAPEHADASGRVDSGLPDDPAGTDRHADRGVAETRLADEIEVHYL